MTRLIRTALAAALRELADLLAPADALAFARDVRLPSGGPLPAGVVGYALGGRAVR